MLIRFRQIVVAAGVATTLLASASCEQQTSTSPGAIGLPFTESFVGTLQPAGEAFYAFSMSQSGVVSLTLLSMTGTSIPADALFTLGIGQPFGTNCSAPVNAAAAPGASPQYSASRAAGVYCVKITDSGARLGAAANFALNITHPR